MTVLFTEGAADRLGEFDWSPAGDGGGGCLEWGGGVSGVGGGGGGEVGGEGSNNDLLNEVYKSFN